MRIQWKGLLTALVAGSFGCLLSTGALAAEFGPWKVSGDLRVSYQNLWRDTRAGDDSTSDVLGGRARLRVERGLGGNWDARVRLAATFVDSGNDFDFFVRSNRQQANSITPGSITFDEAWVRYRSTSRNTDLRIGRQSHSNRLPLVVDRTLDRHPAVNLDIGWTDGIQLTQNIVGGWKANLFVQYNSADGNGTTSRGPLDFSDSGSRVSYYLALRSDDRMGPVFLRALGLTLYPDALASEGVADPEREDYVALTFKAAADWDVGGRIGAAGTRLVLAGEVGRAFNRPTEAAMRLGDRSDVDGLAWQVGADLRNFVPRHNLGVLYGRVQAGWLIASDFRENDDYLEFRYIFNVNHRIAWELRARQREEIDRRVGSVRAQRDRDLRTRITLRF